MGTCMSLVKTKAFGRYSIVPWSKIIVYCYFKVTSTSSRTKIGCLKLWFKVQDLYYTPLDLLQTYKISLLPLQLSTWLKIVNTERKIQVCQIFLLGFLFGDRKKLPYYSPPNIQIYQVFWRVSLRWLNKLCSYYFPSKGTLFSQYVDLFFLRKFANFG